MEPRRRPPLALPFGDDHVDDLPTAGREVGEQPGGFVRQRPRLGLRRLGKMSDDAGIDRVGLGALTNRLGEGAHLRPD